MCQICGQKASDQLYGSTLGVRARSGVLWVCTSSWENYRPAKPLHSDRVMDTVAMKARKKRILKCCLLTKRWR